MKQLQIKPGPKRKKPSQMVEEAYHTMKKISSALEQQSQEDVDEFDVYGKHVANEIRGLGEKLLQTEAKYKINKILYGLEMRKIQSMHSGFSSGASSVCGQNSTLFDDSTSDNGEDSFASVLLNM